MPTPRPVALLSFAAWTLFVWVGRIRNVLADRSVSAGSRAVTVSMSTAFVLGAVAVAVVALRPVTVRTRRRVVAVVGALTVVVWLVRGADIAFGGDHPAGFVAVHVVLAVLSIGAAGWAWSSVGRLGGPRGAGEPAAVG